MSFGAWLNDFRWAMNVMRARAWRRRLSFSKRMKFDAAMRHSLTHSAVIDYPDAFYHTDIHDVCRAMRVAESAFYDVNGKIGT